MDLLETSELRLRAALDREDFAGVQEAVRAYRAAFDRTWRGMPSAARRASALPLEADRLMRWAILQVTMARASLAERRRVSGAAGSYLGTGRNLRNRTWGAAG